MQLYFNLLCTLPHCIVISSLIKHKWFHFYQYVKEHYPTVICSSSFFHLTLRSRVDMSDSQVALVATSATWESACQCKRLKTCGFDPWVGKNPWVGMATHYSTLVWKMPWKEEPSGYIPQGCRVGHYWAHTHTHTHTHTLVIIKKDEDLSLVCWWFLF